jgi:hypothetical protein
MLTGTDKRVAECLRCEVEALARRYGVERLGFLTLTFRNKVVSYKTAQVRWNSLVTGQLRDRYERMIVTWERDKGRKVHWHAVVVLPFNACRESFDFDASRSADREYRRAGKSALWRMFDAQRTASACESLRAEWRWLRTVLPKYGFGRHRLEPVKGAAEALARYAAKYIGKQLEGREAGDRGARRVRYIGFSEVVTLPARGSEPTWRGRVSTRTARPEFGWSSPGARVWRCKVGEWAGGLGLDVSDLWPDRRDDFQRLMIEGGAWRWRGWQWSFRNTIGAESVGALFWERGDEAALGVECAVQESLIVERAVRAEEEARADEWRNERMREWEEYRQSVEYLEAAEEYAKEFAIASFGA